AHTRRETHPPLHAGAALRHGRGRAPLPRIPALVRRRPHRVAHGEGGGGRPHHRLQDVPRELPQPSDARPAGAHPGPLPERPIPLLEQPVALPAAPGRDGGALLRGLRVPLPHVANGDRHRVRASGPPHGPRLRTAGDGPLRPQHGAVRGGPGHARRGGL
ncbi:MAG: Ribosome association toxin RatA, partial [uncultured Acetobacteraceae bacterium]